MDAFHALEAIGYPNIPTFLEYNTADDEDSFLCAKDGDTDRTVVLDCNGHHVGWIEEVIDDSVWQSRLCRVNVRPGLIDFTATLYYPEDLILLYRQNLVLLTHSIADIIANMEHGILDDFIIFPEGCVGMEASDH